MSELKTLDYFDLEVLFNAELDKAEITPFSNTLCADSYVGIKEIFKRRELCASS